MEFIRPIVEERSAKMKEFGDDWDDAPVRQPSYSILSIYILTPFMRWEHRVIC
jgi:hypothetical protein